MSGDLGAGAREEELANASTAPPDRLLSARSGFASKGARPEDDGAAVAHVAVATVQDADVPSERSTPMEQTVVPVLGQFSDEAFERKRVKIDSARSTGSSVARHASEPHFNRRSLPGLMSLPDGSGTARSMSPSQEISADGLTPQYLDMRIAKIRGIVDWRINDMSRVMRQTEDAWTEQLENERKTRQDSVAAVRQLAETQKLILESGISHESSRVDSVVNSIASILSEIKALSEVAAQTGDEIQKHKDRMDSTVGTHQLDLLEKRLQCEIDVHKATLSQAVSKERLRIDTLRTEVEQSPSIRQRLPDGPSLDTADTGFFPVVGQEAFMIKIGSVQTEHAGRLQAIEEALVRRQSQDQEFDKHIQGIAAEFAAQREALERAQLNFLRTEAAAKQDHECLEMLRLKSEALSSNSSSTVSTELDARIAGLMEKFDKHAEEVAAVKHDVKTWETLLTDYVVQGKERSDELSKQLESLRLQPMLSSLDYQPAEASAARSQDGSEPLASAEALQAMLETRFGQLTTRIDGEQVERKRMQTSLSDLQTMQYNNGQELNALRAQLQTVSDRVRESSDRLDTESQEVRDALTAMEREVKEVEGALYQTASAQDTGARMKSLAVSLEEQVNGMMSLLKHEEHQRKEAFDAVRHDVDRVPAMIWDTVSGEMGRIDTVSKQLEEVVPRVQALESELAERMTEILGITEIVGILERDRNTTKGIHKDREESIAQQLGHLKAQQDLLFQPALSTGPQVRELGQRCERLQATVERLEMTSSEAMALIERTMSESESSLRDHVAKERQRLDIVFPEVQALRSEVQEMKTQQLRQRLELQDSVNGQMPQHNSASQHTSALSLSSLITSVTKEREQIDARCRELEKIKCSGDDVPQLEDLQPSGTRQDLDL
jgi:chromosome segregation ATPase